LGRREGETSIRTSGMKITTGFGVWASNSILFALSQPKTYEWILNYYKKNIVIK